MPIDGIPLVLENKLLSVFKSHSLKSWNIFDDQNGCVSFRLRFSPHTQTHSGQEIPADVKVSGFRRKSPSQINRDRERAMRHNQKHQVVQLNEDCARNDHPKPLEDNCDNNDHQPLSKPIDNGNSSKFEISTSEMKIDQHPEAEFLHSGIQNNNFAGQNIAAKPFEPVSASLFMNQSFQDDHEDYDDTACNLVQLIDDVHDFSMMCSCLTCLTEASKRSWEKLRNLDKKIMNYTGT